MKKFIKKYIIFKILKHIYYRKYNRIIKIYSFILFNDIIY